MKTNIKKIVLGLGGAASVIAPIATAVSCDGGGAGAGNWAGKNDGKYSIMTAFSATGPQHKALEEVIKLWNDTHTDKQIDIVDVEGGYAAIAPQLAQEFEANDTTKMPNLIIDYPDTIGTIAKYVAQLNLDNETGAIRKLFNNSFVGINDQIGGVDAGKLFALPIAKSVDMAAYNAPVFKVIIELARRQGLFDIETNTPEVEKILAKVGTTDEAAVKTLWVAKATLPTFTTRFGDEILTDSSKMLDFITQAATMFDQTKNPTGAIFGIDSATNFIYSSVFQKTGGDFNKFLFSKGADGYINYNWNNQNSDGYKIFAEVYGKLQKAIDAGAVYINNGGAYSSGLETQHKIAFAYGSTAGYSYDYVSGSGGNEIIAKDDKDVDVKLAVSFTGHFDASKATTDVAGEFGSGTHNNKIYLSTSQHDLPTTGKVYDIKLADAAKDKEVQDFIANNPGTLYVSSADTANKVTKKVDLGIVNGHEKYLVVATATAALGASATLQKDELVVEQVPTTFDTATKATLIQGPSLIGVHNSSEDAVTKEFVNWFMTEKIAAENDKTPAEIFADKANYVLPTITALANQKTTAKDAAKVTINALQEIAGGKALAFDNPADDTTGDFRKVLQSTIAAQYTNHVNNQPTSDAKEIYEAVKHSTQN